MASESAEGEGEMTDHDGEDTRPPPSENHEYAPDDYASSRSAARLLRPRRSYGRPLFALWVVALLVAIAFSRIGSVDQLNLYPQIETSPPPKRPDRFIPEQPVEPFKSLVLDAAQAYLLTGRPPK
jgi:hypothetical protein